MDREITSEKSRPALRLLGHLCFRRSICARPGRLFHEDTLARVPTLTMSWPTVRTYHADAYPLELLAALLAEGKRSPLYAVVVDEEKLAPSVDAYTEGGELAGKFNIWIQGFEHTDLNRVARAVHIALDRFEQDGFGEADLDRVKAVRETAFYDGYNSISSVLGKAFALAEYHIFAGSPGYLSEDIRRVLSVTARRRRPGVRPVHPRPALRCN